MSNLTLVEDYITLQLGVALWVTPDLFWGLRPSRQLCALLALNPDKINYLEIKLTQLKLVSESTNLL